MGTATRDNAARPAGIDLERRTREMVNAKSLRAEMSKERNMTRTRERAPKPTVERAATGLGAMRTPPNSGARAAAPTEEMIRLRAYWNYVERRDGPGDALSDWLRAEADLRDEFRRRAAPTSG